MKRIKNFLVLMAVIICTLGVNVTAWSDGGINVDDVLALSNEEGSAKMSEIKVATKNIKAYAQMEKTSSADVTFNKGDTLFVTGEIDGWYSIFYQGKTYYVSKDDDALATDESIDMDAVNQELDDIIAEGKIINEEVYRIREERKRARIWGIIIVILVVIIFVMGVLSMIKSKKDDAEEEDEKNLDAQDTERKDIQLLGEDELPEASESNWSEEEILATEDTNWSEEELAATEEIAWVAEEHTEDAAIEEKSENSEENTDTVII